MASQAKKMIIPTFTTVNNDTPPPQLEERGSLNRSKQHTDKDSDGLVGLKSFTMHGFKESDSSPNPSRQFSIKDRDEDPVTDPQKQLLFTESMIMDYVTLKGIENRFGVKRQDIPISIFKELIDNSLDHVETLAVTPSDHDFMPEIHVQITSDGDRLRLEVLNSDIKPSFTLERIRSIFNFNNFSSTKRNQYKISRGALGNGLKAILGMSYALATENYNYDDWGPLKIRTGNIIYSIALIVDKINGKDRPVFADIKSEKCISDNNGIQTAVKIDIPTNRN